MWMPSNAGGHLQDVAGAAAPSQLFDKNSPAYQIADVAQRGVLGTLCQFRPFRGSQFSLKTIQQAVDDPALPVIERLPGMDFPKPILDENGLQCFFRCANRPL